jgi:hypothetical protein
LLVELCLHVRAQGLECVEHERGGGPLRMAGLDHQRVAHLQLDELDPCLGDLECQQPSAAVVFGRVVTRYGEPEPTCHRHVADRQRTAPEERAMVVAAEHVRGDGVTRLRGRRRQHELTGRKGGDVLDPVIRPAPARWTVRRQRVVPDLPQPRGAVLVEPERAGQQPDRLVGVLDLDLQLVRGEGVAHEHVDQQRALLGGGPGRRGRREPVGELPYGRSAATVALELLELVAAGSAQHTPLLVQHRLLAIATTFVSFLLGQLDRHQQGRQTEAKPIGMIIGGSHRSSNGHR